MVIVHHNGFYRMLVHFCYCSNAPSKPIQLCNEQLFPATMDQPHTAFTFSVLDSCHIHSLSSKKPMNDFYDALVKMTSPAFPQEVPVCHKSIPYSELYLYVLGPIYGDDTSLSSMDTLSFCPTSRPNSWYR
jgi:hypothetical protein